ncbi:MAG TPA: acylphosphatase [Candidatus Polarisedimenticolia bacterium]|jgi:acylphosphatase
MVARRFYVRGRVQGVGFRWFVVGAAQRLNLSGWTRNLPDGRVEVLAQGEPPALLSLAEELRAGPRAAGVEAVDSNDETPDLKLRDFSVR